MWPLGFPESHTTASRELFLQESPAGRDPRPQLAPEEALSASADRPLPSLLHPGQRTHLDRGFLVLTFNEGFSLQTAVAAKEREGFYLFPVPAGSFGIAVFLPACPLALGVPLSLPSSEALLPTLPARRQPPSQSSSWRLF